MSAATTTRAAPPILAEPADAAPRETGRLLLRPVGWIVRGLRTVIGVVTMIVGLAVVATVPILQLVSLGYLLEVSGRIVRTGRVRSGFIGVKPAGTVGCMLIVLGLAWLPLRYAGSMAENARIIAPGSGVAERWETGMMIGLMALFAALLAVFGLLQWRRPQTYSRLRDGLWILATKNLPFYFLLGLKGFLAGLLWLALPISLLVLASLVPREGQPAADAAGIALGLAGAALLVPVVMYLPFVQARLAAQNRLRAAIELKPVREQFRRAPFAFWIAFTATVLFAAPLYLLKIEVVPKDAAWLPGLVFVIFIFPARLLVGWAASRGEKRQSRRHWTVRWLSRLALVSVAVAYAVIVFFSQFTGWHGVWGLYEQHAFLLPVPFLGL
jgi:hypothetical protein